MIISVFPYIENESVRRLTGDVLSELDRLKCHVYVTQECAGQLPGHHVVYSKPDKMMEDCDLAIAIGATVPPCGSPRKRLFMTSACWALTADDWAL